MIERYADIIKERVSVPRMLEYYGFDTNNKGRIPCPLHQGKNQNFGYKDKFWHCFVCGEGGDVIKFVQAYFGIDFKQAIKKLNRDFNIGLPIDEKPTLRQQRELEKRNKEVLDKERKRKEEKTALDNEYRKALSEWAMLDKVSKMSEPKSVEEFENVSNLYIYTLQHIGEAMWKLEQAEKRLYDYEHS